MLPANSLTPGSPLTMLDAASATTAPATILLLKGQSQEITIVLQSNGTTSGGTLQIEEAYYPCTVGSDGPVYTGTWSAIGSAITASSFSGTAQQVVHIIGCSCWAVRVRVATTITGGGSVTAVGWGN